MTCIYCGSKTEVANSRLQKRSNTVWRRRRCRRCGAIFTTLEAPDLSSALVVQYAHGKTAPLSRDRLLVSLLNPLSHRKDAIAAAGALTSTILAELLQTHPGPVLRVFDIAKTAHSVLARFDSAAAISYAAHHAQALKEVQRG